MSPPCARRHHAGHPPTLPRHLQLERLAPERAVGFGTQHVADVGPRHPNVAAREDDPQLADPAGRRRPAHFDIGDGLQPVPSHIHHRRKRPRQYSAQLGTIPLFAPAEPRREVAVVAAAPALVRDRAQVGPRRGGLEYFFDPGGPVPARGMEVGVDQLAAVQDHLPRGRVHGVPRLWRLARDAIVHLVAYVGVGVEALGLPAAAIAERERAGHDRLREQRGELVGTARPQLRRDDARDVALDGHAVDEQDPRRITHEVEPPAVAAPVRHSEPPFGDVHREDSGMWLARGAVGPQQADARRVGHHRPADAGGDGADQLACRVVGEDQLAAFGAPERDAWPRRREPDPQLGLRPDGGDGRSRAPHRDRGQDASDPAPVRALRRAL